MKYEVIRDRYSSDVSDEEFELIAPLLPAPKKRGRKPTDFGVTLNDVFYMVRVGCLWRLSPKDFPPVTTVQNRFLRLAGQWTVAANLRRTRNSRARGAGPRARADGRRCR